MARDGVYKICGCRNRVKCAHPWWFSYKARGLRRFRKSLDAVLGRHIDSKTDAIKLAAKIRVDVDDDTLPARMRKVLGLPFSDRPALETLTLAQLLDTFRERYLTLERQASAENDNYQIATIKRTVIPRVDGSSPPFSDWLVADITADTLERFREARRVRETRKTDKGVRITGGLVTGNRNLALLRAAFNWAIRVGYVERTPFKRGTEPVVKLSREASRSRRLQTGEEERLLVKCGKHLRSVVEAALETGCRRGELLSMRWHQVQFKPQPELWLPAPNVKTRKGRRIPISTRLRAILEMRRYDPAGRPVPPDACVFGNEIGQRVRSIKTAWRLTCKRAGISDLHFHDLRREAGSRWMDAGVPLATIQRWLGHTNIAQTSTYLATTTVGEHEAMKRFEERRATSVVAIPEAEEQPPDSVPRTH